LSAESCVPLLRLEGKLTSGGTGCASRSNETAAFPFHVHPCHPICLRHRSSLLPCMSPSSPFLASRGSTTWAARSGGQCNAAFCCVWRGALHTVTPACCNITKRPALCRPILFGVRARRSGNFAEMAASPAYDFGYKPVTPELYLEPLPSTSVPRRTGVPIFSPFVALKKSFDDWRRSKGYEDRPGSVEDLGRAMRSALCRPVMSNWVKFGLQTSTPPTSSLTGPRPTCRRRSRSTPSSKSRTRSPWAAPLEGLPRRLAPTTFRPSEVQTRCVAGMPLSFADPRGSRW
jgi:hypothetical protein